METEFMSVNNELEALDDETKEYIRIIFDECEDDGWGTIQQKFAHKDEPFLAALKGMFHYREEGHTKEDHINYLLQNQKESLAHLRKLYPDQFNLG